MAGYRDLNEGFEDYLARQLKNKPTQTSPSGVIDLGGVGDVTWPDPVTSDQVSVRTLPAKVDEMLEQGLTTASKANTVSTSPAPASTEGYPVGAYWVQIVSVTDQTVLGVWKEEAGAWVAQPYDGGLVAPTIEAGLINVAVLAAQLIVTKLLRTETNPVTHRYSVFDSEGLRVVDTDGPEGSEAVLVNIGPSGDQLLQLGQGENLVSMNSSGGVSARTVSTGNLFVNGKRLRATDIDSLPRGLVAYGRMYGAHSRRLNGRDIVLSLDCQLPPGRVYRIQSSSILTERENTNCRPHFKLHTALDGDTRPWINWDGTSKKEIRMPAFVGTWVSADGMSTILDLTNESRTRDLVAVVSMANSENNGWVQAMTGFEPLWLEVHDVGNRYSNKGNPWYIAQGTPPTPKVRQTVRFNATAMATYRRGGARDETSGFVQGQYSSWNRETLIVFPSMTSTLSGAEIHRITCHSFFDSWYYNDGGTASWNWHGETGIPGSSPAKTFMVDTAGWPRGAAREINIIPEEFNGWKNGVRRGFIFSTPVTALSHYGKLSSDLNQHWIEVEYTK